MEQCFACNKYYQRNKMIHYKKLGVYLHKTCYKLSYEWECEFCNKKYITIVNKDAQLRGSNVYQDGKIICWWCLYIDQGAGI
jgi:hypothetical protein